MPRRVDPRSAEPLRDVLHLLDLYNGGLLPAIVSLGAREEQHLSRLSSEDLDTVLDLLNLPIDNAAQTAAGQAVGPEMALSLLGEVLRQPMVPAPGYPYIVHAYQEQHVQGLAGCSMR